MVHCQACGITTTARNYGVTFHRFPKNEQQRSAWIDFVNKSKGLNRNFKCTTLCSQHFDGSCFDKTSALKVRLKPFSIPTIYVSRSKYEKIDTSIATHKSLQHSTSQTRGINETCVINAMDTKTSITDVATINSSNMDNAKIMEESTVNDPLYIDKSELIEQANMESLSSNKNVNLKSLPSPISDTFNIYHKTDVPFKILTSDTPKKFVFKKNLSLEQLLVEKLNLIRKLQKKNWKQNKQILKLKNIIQELRKKPSSDHVYTIM